MNKYTQHTPGPWIFTDLGQITDRNGRIIVVTVSAHNIPNPAYPKGSFHYLVEDDGGEANGRLISAAPDLLDALEIIASGNTDPDDMVEIAREAIAKVGGAE
jgi:threonine dehydrogenase-like Zn-dependent dehydrogenase